MGKLDYALWWWAVVSLFGGRFSARFGVSVQGPFRCQSAVSLLLVLLGACRCFFVGAFGHSAFVKAQHPDAGSNFFAIIVAMLLLAWVGKKLGFIGKTA